jgi:hypothetical protein
MSSSLYKIVNGMRYFGVGAKVTRDIYKKPETYWTITKVKLSKDQNHGTIFGRLVWNGRMKGKDQRINTALKKQWSLIETPKYSGASGYRGAYPIKEEA